MSRAPRDQVVTEIRRYPVKSMGGESLPAVDVDERGLAGDRWFAVTDGDARFASGKTTRRFRRRDEIFEYSAQIIEGHVQVSGALGRWQVGDVTLEQVLSQQMGADVRVLAESGTPHQDAGQVSLVGTASLAWCRARFGVDGDARRLRANLVVRTTEPFVEEGWVGQRIRIGDVGLAAVERIQRCRMVDIAQEGLDEQPGWLRALGRERGLCLGVYADVTHPGRLSLHDPVQVMETGQDPGGS